MLTFITILLLPLLVIGFGMIFLIAIAGALVEDFWNIAVKNRTYNPYTYQYEDKE